MTRPGGLLLGGGLDTVLPGEPVNVTAVAGNTEATISWTAPSAGSSPITGYRITPYRATGRVIQPSTTFTTAATTQIVTGLVNGLAYLFTVAAITAVGRGPDSEDSNTVTPTSGPGGGTFAAYSAGSLPVGDADYGVPAGAKYVDPVNGSNTAGPGRGNSNAPYLTVQAAINGSGSGTTVVMKAGTYRQGQITIPSSKVITLQNVPGEAVWLSGSVIIPSGNAGPVPTGPTQWVADGNDWRHDNWKVRFDRTKVNPVTIDPQYPAAGYPDQVFIDGVRQVQKLTRPAGGLNAGEFFLNESTDGLYIGTNPSGKKVEASTAGTAVLAQSADSIMRGFGVEQWATTQTFLGPVRMIAPRQQLENLVGRLNALAAFVLTKPTAVAPDNCEMSKLTAYDNGKYGMQGGDGDNFVVDLCLGYNNNVERFVTNQAVGGIKLAWCTNARLRDCNWHDNIGQGAWLDLFCTGSHIVRNLGKNNTGVALFYEVSQDGIIAGNLCHDNFVGIQTGETATTKFWNNTLHNNSWQLRIYDGNRVRTSPQEGNLLIPTVQGFDTHNNIFSHDGSSANPQISCVDANNVRNLDVMNYLSDDNAFYRKVRANVPLLGRLAPLTGPGGAVGLATVAAVRGHTNGSTPANEVNSIFTDDAATNPYLNSDYTPKDTVIRGTAAAVAAGLSVATLPSDVASAIGWAAGKPRALGAIQ